MIKQCGKQRLPINFFFCRLIPEFNSYLVLQFLSQLDHIELLMLDEPVAGMNSGEKAIMVDHVKKIRDDWGITILLVEHDMRTVMNLCDKITVLDFGEKLAEGLPEEIIHNKKVIEAYLGADEIVA